MPEKAPVGNKLVILLVKDPVGNMLLGAVMFALGFVFLADVEVGSRHYRNIGSAYLVLLVGPLVFAIGVLRGIWSLFKKKKP